MKKVTMQEVSSDFFRLIDAIELGSEKEIIITRRGKPAAKLVPINDLTSGPRIGVAEGKFIVPDSIDINNDKIAELFLGK